jgi:hypothetical protein
MRKKEPPHPIRVAKTIDVIARYERLDASKTFSIIQSQTTESLRFSGID